MKYVEMWLCNRCGLAFLAKGPLCPICDKGGALVAEVVTVKDNGRRVARLHKETP